MLEEVSQAFSFAIVWMVIYGMLAFGWVTLRDVNRTHGGLLFKSFFYTYTAVGVAGLVYLFARLGLPMFGADTAFLLPLELIVGSVSSLMQVAGVLAVATGMIIFIVRYFQDRATRANVPPPSKQILKQPKHKHARP